MVDVQRNPYDLGEFTDREDQEALVDIAIDYSRLLARDELTKIRQFSELLVLLEQENYTDAQIMWLVYKNILAAWNGFEVVSKVLPNEVIDPVYQNTELQAILQRAGVPLRT